MRIAICGLAAALLAGSAGGALAAPHLATADDLRREIGAVMKLPDTTAGKVYDARMEPVLASPAFETLQPLERCTAYWLAGAAKVDLQQFDAADRYYAKVVECPEVPKEAWGARYDAALRAGDWDAAVSALQTIVDRFPELPRTYSDQAVLATLARARALEKGPERQFVLLNALFDSEWKPSDPGLVMDRLWANLAASLVDRGLTIRAGRVVQRIGHPWTLAYIRSDKRFDDLFDHAAPQFDPEKQSRVELEFRRKLVADHPERLRYAVEYALDLVQHRHPDAALTLIDGVQARIAAAPVDKPPYTDMMEQSVWVKDYRRRALMELGRDQEALALAVEASRDKEQGSDNVSQVINLAGIYDDLGRPRDALATLDLLKGGASPYGLMQAEAVRAIAYVQLGDKAGLAKSMAYLKAHEADAEGAVVEPLIWAGDLDAVAAIYLARLADPDQRLGALGDLQRFASPLHPTPAQETLHQRWEALRARPDIRAAVEKVGRINPAYSFMDAPG